MDPTLWDTVPSGSRPLTELWAELFLGSLKRENCKQAVQTFSSLGREEVQACVHNRLHVKLVWLTVAFGSHGCATGKVNEANHSEQAKESFEAIEASPVVSHKINNLRQMKFGVDGPSVQGGNMCKAKGYPAPPSFMAAEIQTSRCRDIDHLASSTPESLQ